MRELEPDFSRVVVDVRSEHLDDLMATLGDFALQHDGMAVHMAISPDDIAEGSVLTEDDTVYNPEFVTWVDDADAGTRMATVTKSNLYDYAIKRGYSSNFPRRVYLTLRRSIGGDPIHGPSHNTGDYFHRGLIRTEGLLASKLPELVDALTDGSLCVNLVGPLGIRLLGEYAQALYRSEDVEAMDVL